MNLNLLTISITDPFSIQFQWITFHIFKATQATAISSHQNNSLLQNMQSHPAAQPFTFHRWSAIVMWGRFSLFCNCKGGAGWILAFLGTKTQLAEESHILYNVWWSDAEFSSVVLCLIEGHLPVKYLGVPLISSRLTYCNCIQLKDRILQTLKDQPLDQ